MYFEIDDYRPDITPSDARFRRGRSSIDHLHLVVVILILVFPVSV
jgi:hypothetical protein